MHGVVQVANLWRSLFIVKPVYAELRLESYWCYYEFTCMKFKSDDDIRRSSDLQNALN